MPKPYGATAKGQLEYWIRQQKSGRRFTARMIRISVLNRKVSKSAVSSYLSEFAINGIIRRCQVMVGRNSTWIKN